jgi:hypothetical protein
MVAFEHRHPSGHLQTNRYVRFVEGARSVGALTRLLPLIERLPCGHTGTRNYAAVAIRILRDGAPKVGVRLIGRVYTDDQANRLPAPGVGISIDGPSESTVSSTDSDGIYDASGLPPGRYTLHLAANSANGRSMFGVKTPVFELKAGDWRRGFLPPVACLCLTWGLLSPNPWDLSPSLQNGLFQGAAHAAPSHCGR